MKRWTLFAAMALVLGFAVLAGCSSLDERQRAWIFQPGDRAWGGGLAAAEGMEDVWIDFQPRADGEAARLHGLWLPAAAQRCSCWLTAARTTTPTRSASRSTGRRWRSSSA